MNIKYANNLTNPRINWIIVHNSGGIGSNAYAKSQHLTVAKINSAHKVRWPEFKSSLGYHVGYTFVIEKNGKITQTRAVGEEGAHCKYYNSNTIGICLTGNFTEGVEYPTAAQRMAFVSLCRELPKVSPNNIVPHRALGNTTCYGSGLAESWARDLLRIGESDKKKEIRRLQRIINDLLAQIRKLQRRADRKMRGFFGQEARNCNETDVIG